MNNACIDQSFETPEEVEKLSETLLSVCGVKDSGKRSEDEQKKKTEL